MAPGDDRDMTATPNPSRLLDRILRPTDPVRLPPPPLRRQYRIGLGLSQQQVADLVSELAGRPCDRSTVGRWERTGNGRRDPQGELQEAYSRLLTEMKERVG